MTEVCSLTSNDMDSTIIFTCVRLYYAYRIDFDNTTKYYAIASVSSAVQNGIAVMVASSPMLRPVFDRTVLKWLGISVRSAAHTSGKMQSNQDIGRPSFRSVGVKAGHGHTRANGLNRISDSEGHLAWEMQNLDKSRGSAATAHASRSSDDSGGQDLNSGSRGAIVVTKTTRVER